MSGVLMGGGETMGFNILSMAIILTNNKPYAQQVSCLQNNPISMPLPYLPS